MSEFTDRLKKDVAQREEYGDDMDDASWGMQEGVLITVNEAKKVIKFQSENQRLRELARKFERTLLGYNDITGMKLLEEIQQALKEDDNVV